jgi:hemerythrin-like domain-containing protein
MSSNIDLYRDVHKGQRHRFSKISTRAGELDYTDPKALNDLRAELHSFREHMRLHASLEERFIHSMLSRRTPDGAVQLEEDHRVIRREFDDLVKSFDGIIATLPDYEQRGELALEFYRAWSRFTAFYFTHIDREEEVAMPLLWKLYTVGELAEAHKLMITSQKKEELVEDYEMILPNANPRERVEILGMLRVMTSPEEYQEYLSLAERILEPSDWANLKKGVGAP